MKKFISFLLVFVMSFTSAIVAMPYHIFGMPIQEFSTPDNKFFEIKPMSSYNENLGALIESTKTIDGSTREIYSLTNSEEIQERLEKMNHPMAGEEVYEIRTIIFIPPLQDDNTFIGRSSMFLRNVSSSDRWYF